MKKRQYMAPKWDPTLLRQVQKTNSAKVKTSWWILKFWDLKLSGPASSSTRKLRKQWKKSLWKKRSWWCWWDRTLGKDDHSIQEFVTRTGTMWQLVQEQFFRGLDPFYGRRELSLMGPACDNPKLFYLNISIDMQHLSPHPPSSS